MLAIYILLQQTLICLFCSLFCSCSLWFCLFVSAACSSACWWQRGYRLMMVVALICLAEKYRANRMQHCRPEIGSSVDNFLMQTVSDLQISEAIWGGGMSHACHMTGLNFGSVPSLSSSGWPP